MAGLLKFGQLSAKDVSLYTQWGKGPKIVPTNLEPWGDNGRFLPGSDKLLIDEGILDQLEKALKQNSKEALLLVISTILHEFTHFGDDQDNEDYPGEEGKLFEQFVYGTDIANLSDARKVIAKFTEQQKENDDKKKNGLKTLVSNFGNLQEGTYVWNGSEWAKEEKK
ncbi:MAG TPA: hypothetical protein VK462_00345, partial [Nitrososphaeraceae archaeon]|nr:hypothetical protein [Nitrososphaeraceae archaeon]